LKNPVPASTCENRLGVELGGTREARYTGFTMIKRLTPDAAATLALDALAYLAGVPDAFDRFADLSGLDRNTVRERAQEPSFLVAVLDFLLTDERLLVEFCGDASIDPQAVHMARHLLDRHE
jgi:hypothetical protein